MNAQRKLPEKESARGWYERTTRRWRTALIWATIIAICGAVALYSLASFSFLARLQTFNGAAVIPTAALIWILAFVYIFLVPNREVGFRSQESIEQTVETLKTTTERLEPVIAVWRRIGERFERELPQFIEEVREAITNIRTSAERIEHAVQKNDDLARETKPVVDALRRISGRVEQEIQIGLFENAQTAFEAVKNMSGIPKNATEPDIGRTLSVIGKTRRTP